MQEFCEAKNGHIEIKYIPRKGENIRKQGGEFSAGATVLGAGMRITPPVIGLLATLGYKSFAVHKKPRVAIIISGDELVKPGNGLNNGQIYDANSFALEAALKALGIADKHKCPCKRYILSLHVLLLKRQLRRQILLFQPVAYLSVSMIM